MADGFAVQTKAHQVAAEEYLGRRASHTHLSMVSMAQRRNARWQSAVEPLFFGYLPTDLDMGSRPRDDDPIDFIDLFGAVPLSTGGCKGARRSSGQAAAVTVSRCCSS